MKDTKVYTKNVIQMWADREFTYLRVAAALGMVVVLLMMIIPAFVRNPMGTLHAAFIARSLIMWAPLVLLPAAIHALLAAIQPVNPSKIKGDVK